MNVLIDQPLLKQLLSTCFSIERYRLGCLISDNKVITEESTFISLELADLAKIYSVAGASGGGSYLMWFRCVMAGQRMDSGWYMSDSNWDAIKLTPQRKVKLVGSGVFPPTGDPPNIPAGWTLEFKIVVDGTESDLFIFTSSDDNWDEQYKIYKCVFRDHGGKDIVCDAG